MIHTITIMIIIVIIIDTIIIHNAQDGLPAPASKINTTITIL